MTTSSNAAHEREARAFIEDVVGETLSGDLQTKLKSGVILCKMINKLKPGSVATVNYGSMPFMMMENVQSYINACKKCGIPETYLFMTVDLFEGKNMAQVILNINTVKRTMGYGFSKTPKSEPIFNLGDKGFGKNTSSPTVPNETYEREEKTRQTYEPPPRASPPNPPNRTFNTTENKPLNNSDKKVQSPTQPSKAKKERKKDYVVSSPPPPKFDKWEPPVKYEKWEPPSYKSPKTEKFKEKEDTGNWIDKPRQKKGSMEAFTESPKSETMFCPSCGAKKLEYSDKFCRGCGKML